MREFLEEAEVKVNGDRGTLMMDSTKIAEIIGTWSESDPKCQKANLVPVMSPSGRTFLRVARETAEAPNRYYLIPAGIAVPVAVKGYELIPTDSPEWLLVDMRQVREKQIAFRFESIDECCGICLVDLSLDNVCEFKTLSDYDLWLVDHDHNDAGAPTPEWSHGSYEFPDGTWKELRIEPESPMDASL